MGGFLPYGSSSSESGGVNPDADDVSYDNTVSGLAATQVQAAIDETLLILIESSYSGFFVYENSAGSIPITANTWTDLPNDTLGSGTLTEFAPNGINNLIDTSTGYLDSGQVPLGSMLTIRNDYEVTPSINNSILEFRFVGGAVGSQFMLERNKGALSQGAGMSYRQNLEATVFYIPDENTRQNPIRMQVRLSSDGTLQNHGTLVGITL